MSDRRVDWALLRAAADAVSEMAYAPYSGLRVGAAGLADDGRVVTGCNVENASFGLTLCAECGVVSELYRTGGGALLAISCTSPDREDLLMPCGRCRQLLWEAGGPGLLVDDDDGPLTLEQLLPAAFGPEDLP